MEPEHYKMIAKLYYLTAGVGAALATVSLYYRHSTTILILLAVILALVSGTSFELTYHCLEIKAELMKGKD